MLNFASLFNQWRSQPSSGVFELIETPNVKMGQLLDEETFLTQYKGANAKITDFMKYPRYEELIEFVTVVGPSDDKKRSYKYPLSACQVLSIENAAAIDLFLPDKPIMLDNKHDEEVQVQTEIQVEESPPQKKEDEIAQKSQQKPVQEKEIIKDQLQAQVSKQAAPEGQRQVQTQTLDVVKQQPKHEQPAKVETPKKMKKVIKKQKKMVQKVIKYEVPPLINKLLSYFAGQVNYTLAGYVSKILCTLLTKKPVQLFKYVLHENVIHQIINHAQSRSVGDLIVKILTHESTHSLDLRRDFFKQLLNRLSNETQIYVESNLSAYVCEIIEKVAANLKGANKITQLGNIFFSLDVITQVIRNVVSQEENVSVYNAPVLLTYLTNVPFVLPEDEEVVKEFKKLGELFVEKSCEKLEVTHRSRPTLGGGRIKILQILRFVIKENILNSKDIVAQKPTFFPTLFKLVKQYDMNNVMHNEVIKILQIALTEAEGSPLNNSVLSNNVILNFLSQESEQDRKIRTGGSVYRYRKGYIAHLINLGIRLRELSKDNQNIKTLINTPQFSNIYETFIEKEAFNSRKSLAGLQMKKDIKHVIMFQKEDIIAAHLTFLQKCPTSVYEPEPQPEQQHVNIEHPDLVEQLQKQLEQNLTIKAVKEEQGGKEGAEGSKSTVAAAEEEQVQEQGQFWTTHLQYNIDDLIADL